MENKGLVSMVVAIYKSEKFLTKLLDSIKNQTYKNYEAILVDDGSPDNSGKICDEYAQNDSKFKVIHEENSGTCAARNAGMNAAKGEYLVIIDGDDWLEPDFLEYLVTLATSTNSDMAFSDKIFTTRDRDQTVNDKIEIWSSEDAAAAIIYPHMEIGPWNKIYKLSMLRKYNINFSTKWSGEGLYFAAMAAQRSNHVGVGHRKIYNYRLNNSESGLTHYKVEMATNALENIRLLKQNLVIKTPKLINAVNWHIWKNNYFVMYLIIATHSIDDNRKLYDDCYKYIRSNLIKTLIHSQVCTREKFKMIYITLFPEKYAYRKLSQAEEGLKNDHME